jgi:hypothetical protein
MYWDVVEVKAEPDYCLFVCFKDGLSGRVKLREDDLTGALAPLRDTRVFERAFVDYGAVAWPGDIDLAPDAMYEEVASMQDPLRVGQKNSHR